MTDFGKIDKYREFVEKDPFRRGLHYPAVVDSLGDEVHKRILDVGCGDGSLPRLLARKGATVTGYDMAAEKIAEAETLEATQKLGITYKVATPETFNEGEFDNAVSVMVLPYATSPEQLTEFFRSTCKRLMEGGRFISVIFNPKFQGFGMDLGARKFTKLPDNEVLVEFIDPETRRTQFTSMLRQYSTHEYDQAARKGGMIPALWSPLYATKHAEGQFGKAFWGNAHREQPYSVFEVQKDE